MTAGAAAIKTILIADDAAFVRDGFRPRCKTRGTGPSRRRAPQSCWAASGGPQRARPPRARPATAFRVGIELVRAIRNSTAANCPSSSSAARSAARTRSGSWQPLGIAGYINEYSAAQHILPSLAPHLFPDSFNRRSSPRVVLGIPVAYRFGDTITAALTLNLGKGGIEHAHDEPAPGGFADQTQVPPARREARGRGRRRGHLERPPHRHGTAVPDDSTPPTRSRSTSSWTATSSRQRLDPAGAPGRFASPPNHSASSSAMDQASPDIAGRLGGRAGARRRATGSSSLPSSRSSRSARRESTS